MDDVGTAVQPRVWQHEATRGGEGLGADIPKLSHSGSVSGCFQAAGCRGGCCGVMPPPLSW
jgi:hypothetical protein